MDYIEKAITEYVKRSQDEYHDHSIYREYLGKMEKTPLAQLNEIHVVMIIKPFLYEWGKMGRVLGQKEFIGWEREIAEQVHSNLENLEKFKAMHLLNTNLTDFKKDIIKAYESFKIIVERVAATKVLHIICPNFFPLWDNAIKEVVKAELIRTISKGIEDFIEKDFDLLREKIEDFSGEDYYIYMRMTQYFVERYKRTFYELAKTYKKGVVKVLDDFLWMTAHRPLSLFFQESSTM